MEKAARNMASSSKERLFSRAFADIPLQRRHVFPEEAFF